MSKDALSKDAITKDAISKPSRAELLADPDRVYEQVVDLIVSEGMVDRDKVTPDATFETLGLKSVDIVMILTAVEEKFDVYIPMDGSIAEAKDLKSFIDGVIQRISSEA
jgi:acyl carrier protein